MDRVSSVDVAAVALVCGLVIGATLYGGLGLALMTASSLGLVLLLLVTMRRAA